MLVLIDSSGARVSPFPTGLAMNHFMEFALDANGKTAYAMAICPYMSGLSRVSLETPDTPRVRLPPVACGNRIVVSSDGKLLAVASGGQISILKARTGAVVRTFSAPAAVLDLVFVGQ